MRSEAARFYPQRETEKWKPEVSRVDVNNEEETFEILKFLYNTPVIEQGDDMGMDLDDDLIRDMAEVIDEDKIFVGLKDENGGFIGGGQLWVRYGGEDGHLLLAAVDEEHRGNGYSHLLTQKRIDLAKERGYETVSTNVSWDNPMSLVSKFKSGFLATSIDEDSGCFELSRRINTDDQERYLLTEEAIEIPLQDHDKLMASVGEGYVGVDLKNIYADEHGETQVAEKNDTNPEHWTLILRKSDSLEVVK